MSTPLPRNLVLDRNIGWHQEVFVTPEKNEVNPFLDQKSIAPDYDWSKLMPPSEQGLEFKPQYFLIVVYPLRDYVLANHWHDIQCAAEDNGFGIALKVGQNVDVFYITMATLPSSAKDPWAFPKAIRFCELLATTNVPPSVAIQILNGDLEHKYLPIGRQQGGLCLKHDIPQATFLERYGRFFYFIKDRLVSYGVSLYLTGNTITVVGKPQLELVMEKVIAYAKLCIIDNEVHLKKKLNKKKGNKKKEGRKKKGSKNEEALPLSSATQDEREQEERKQDKREQEEKGNKVDLGLEKVIAYAKLCIIDNEVHLKKKLNKKKGNKKKEGSKNEEALPLSSATQDEREQEEKGNKVDLGLETETTMLKPSMEVDLGLETETTMPKRSRYEPFVVFERATTMPKVLRDQHRVVIDDFVGWEVKIIRRKNNKPDPVVDLGLESETAMSQPFVVDIGFDTEKTTMPKASMERPRIVIDKYVGWGLVVLGPTSIELSSRPETDCVHLEDISPDYNWSKLMPPTKLVRGKLVVEPGWEFKPQFFRVWVYPLREYLLTTEWSDIEVAAADNGFGIVLNKGLKRWYIFAAVGPEDPWAFPKAIRFCELLATTNVPPSVAIDILYGQLGHKFLPIGCQPGGLCLKHGIPQDTFLERYYRFISQTKDIVDTVSGVSLYLTGNTISVVGKPELDLLLEMVAIYAESCILLDEKSANLPEEVKAGFDFMNKQMEAFSHEVPLKKKRSKKKLSNDEERLEKKLRNEEALSQEEPLKKKLCNGKRLCLKNISRRK